MSIAELAGLNTTHRRAQVAQALDRLGQMRYVRLAHPDLMGVLRGRTLRAERVQAAFEAGLGFGARLLFADLNGEIHPSARLGDPYDYGNIYLLPDPTTLTPLPWMPGTGLLLADPYLPDGRPALSSRLALRRAVEGAGRAGLHLRIGLELEGTITPAPGRPGLGQAHHLFSSLGQGQALAVLQPIWETLDSMGLALDGFADEFGPDQFEFNLAPLAPLAAADALLIFKLALREMLQQSGYHLTFMAQTAAGEKLIPNGLHVHQAGYNPQGNNIFWAEAGPSVVLRHYIGGQLAYAAPCAALSTPTLTGYRRYRPGTWAPTGRTWSLDNRTSMLRVTADRDHNARLENRLPDSAANPHLMLAALITAGTLGLRHQLDPGSPVTGDSTTPAVAVPQTIREAIACLQQPSALVEHVGAALIRAYRGVLLSAAERFEAHLSAWEVAEYRNIL